MKKWHKKTEYGSLIILFVSAHLFCCCLMKTVHAEMISTSCHKGLSMQETTDFTAHKHIVDGKNCCDCRPSSQFITSEKKFNETNPFNSPQSIFTLALEKISVSPSQGMFPAVYVFPETLQNATPVYLQKSILRL